METEEESPSPPQPPVEEPSLFAHYPHVFDALNSVDTPVTEGTTLAALYSYDAPNVDNRFLKNRAGICDVRFPTTMMVGRSGSLGIFPPFSDAEEHSYALYMTFSAMASLTYRNQRSWLTHRQGLAPAVRIEVDLLDRESGSHSPYHSLAFEFSFNDRDGKQLQDFEYTIQDEHASWGTISFTANGISGEGFTNIPQDRFTAAEKAFIDLLKTFRHPGEQQEFNFVLKIDAVAELDLEEIRKITDRLPGGSEPLLSTIGAEEYAAYAGDLSSIRAPHRPMSTGPGNLMVALRCGDIFRSVLHWLIENWWAAAMSHWEGEVALQLFAAGRHEIAVYRSRGHAVLAMKFGPMPSIGGERSSVKVRLPNDLEVVMTMSIPGIIAGLEPVTAYHEAHLPGLPKHDAYFIVTSHSIGDFRGCVHDKSNANPEYSVVTSIRPHENSFLLDSLEATAYAMDLPKNRHWVPIALNQFYDDLEYVDVISEIDVPQSVKDSAMAWLRGCMSWNSKQSEVIDLLTNVLGRLGICTGIAGTGKTTLQMAMAIFFVLLGGRAACFATGNVNADTQAEALNKIASGLKVHGRELLILRLNSVSRHVELERQSAPQALHRKVGHRNGNVSHLHSVVFIMKDKSLRENAAWKYSVETAAIKAADEGQLSHMARLRKTGTEPAVNVWDVFREFVSAIRENRFNWKDKNLVERHERAYEAVKGHLVSLCDIIITTNGNARCKELVNYWGKAMGDYEQKITCLAVFIDEVAKEQELHVWNSILSTGLPMKPNFVLLLGDPRQLAPVNTCETRGVQFNPFAERCDKSLIGRLIRGGYPCIHLKEQQRMHPVLSRFPNAEFYHGELEDAEITTRLLDDVEPGLKDVLDGIIARCFHTEAGQVSYLENATDEQARLHYFDLGIHDIFKNDKKSIAIPEHIDAFFELAFPALQGHFQDRMNQLVTVIAGYGHAKSEWKQRINACQDWQELDDAYYPRILTIDASQGQEATMVIMDGTLDYRDKISKHMTDPGRCNVAMTRAKEVFWMIGGPLDKKEPYRRRRNDGMSPFPKLKFRVLQPYGQVHQYERQVKVPTIGLVRTAKAEFMLS
ncbi:Helicase SEN1 [Pseudocercospora fuligena]|uniref:Helicase SEN1 n=1 Tax=Pseudocercospora fuligena TaxID=685502 RepID=A0A8H6RV49_9PEZI|nr:Helicase SEN1 [Pseudocercospora fuligena]